MCYFLFSRNLGSQYLTDFAGIIGSESLTDELYLMPNPLTNFDSIFNTFWVSHFFSYQAGNYAFPVQTLWIFTAVFQQSYTVYTTMVVIPFTPAQMADVRRGSLGLERMVGVLLGRFTPSPVSSSPTWSCPWTSNASAKSAACPQLRRLDYAWRRATL